MAYNAADIFDPYGQGAPGTGYTPVDWSWMLNGLYRPSLMNGGVLAPNSNPFNISFQAGPQQPAPPGVLAPPTPPMPPVLPPQIPPTLPPVITKPGKPPKPPVLPPVFSGFSQNGGQGGNGMGGGGGFGGGGFGGGGGFNGSNPNTRI